MILPCEIVSHRRHVANFEHYLFPFSVFNWKEKKLLRLSLKKDKRENIKIPRIGHLDDILYLFDESKGDRIIDTETFTVEAVPAPDNTAILKLPLKVGAPLRFTFTLTP